MKIEGIYLLIFSLVFSAGFSVAQGVVPGAANTDSIIETKLELRPPVHAGGQGIIIFSDQDYFNNILKIAPNFDRNYTMGFGVNIYGKWTGSNCVFTNYPLKFIERITKLKDHYVHVFSNFTFGMSGFTPQKIDTASAVTDDRPYSSLLYFRSTRFYEGPRNRTIIQSFTLGVLGLAVGGDVQTAIHKAMLKSDSTNRPVPLGWRNQISDGGEVTAMYSVQIRKNLIGKRQRWAQTGAVNSVTGEATQWLQLNAYGEGALGYYTSLMSGFNLRLGLINNYYYMEDNLGYGNSEKAGGGRTIKRPLNLYFFANARGRFWAYNSLLMGQYKPNPHSFALSEISPFTGEYDMGIKLSVGPVQLSWVMISARTAEFKGGKSATQHWGGAAVGLIF